MKKALGIMASLLGIMLLLNCGYGLAASKEATAPKPSAADEKKLAEKRKLIAEKQKDLNGSRWEVLVQSRDKKEKDEKDVLTFQDDQIQSERLSKRGFGSTNYTISVPGGEGAGVWESMKTGSDGVVFMRGEWSKEAMSGSVNEQLEDGKVIKEYYFTSNLRKTIPPTSKPEMDAAGMEAKDAKALLLPNTGKSLIALEDDPLSAPAEE